jgi:uncharacterized protein YeaO (DUF488 family)
VASSRNAGERIRVKRVYEAPAVEDGKRVLVDRLWPRGVRKESLALTLWARDAAPSDTLRKQFGHHDPALWKNFQTRDWAELDANPPGWQAILELAKTGAVTLLYAARDTAQNNAVALREYLTTRISARGARKS